MACERNHQAGGRLGKIDSPRTLPTCEGGYKPFKIGELFDAANGNTDIQKNHIDGVGEYVISSGTTNNGIIGKSSVDAKIFNANTITVDMFGNVYFHPYCYKMVTHARVFSLSAKNFYLNETLGLYFVSTLSYLKNLFSYNNMCSWEKVKDLSIYLPTTAAGDIDFAFIEERVHELEEERVRELETYLKAAGFEDCALSTLEREALSLLSSGISTKYFKIRELFEKQSTIRLGIKVADVSKEKTNAADLPVLTAGIINQGLVGFIPRANATILKNVISVSANGANTGAMFYQPDEFTILQDSYAIGWRDTRRNVEECVYLYLVSCLQKSVRGYYDWSNKAGWEKIKGLTISLPITTDGAIDYAFMETSIRAMEKQCIARLKAAFVREHEAYMQVIF